MLPTEKDFQLAKIFLNHSLKVKPKEKVLISVSDSVNNGLIKAVYIETLKVGAYPLIDTLTNFFINRASFEGLNYEVLKNGSNWQAEYVPEKIIDNYINWADAFVRITTINNKKELTEIAPERLANRAKKISKIFDKMIDKDRWVLTYFPTVGMAQEANVSLNWLQDFYYKACIVDYKKMKNELLFLEKIFDNGSEVVIKGKETNLKLSIKNRLSKASFGERNIPDGEVFMAPVVSSIEGEVFFDLPTIYAGKEVSEIKLKFKKGKVVNAIAKRGQDALDSILKTDEGAKYIGEFAIGANYNISRPLKDTLFDEKIGGTIHMALGRSYKEKRGGTKTGANNSTIHWDIVKDMRFKGSEVLVDGKIVLKDGKIIKQKS